MSDTSCSWLWEQISELTRLANDANRRQITDQIFHKLREIASLTPAPWDPDEAVRFTERLFPGQPDAEKRTRQLELDGRALYLMEHGAWPQRFEDVVESLGGTAEGLTRLARPARVAAPAGSIPFVVRGAGPASCWACDAVWITRTSSVVWHFEGGQELTVCPDCARGDAETKVWQNFCDIVDSVADLMEMADSQELRDLAARLLADQASWFSTWKDGGQ